VALKARLETDSYKPTVTRYVYLHIDANKEQTNYQAWSKLYKSKGNGIPAVFIVRSDGKELFNQSGGIGLEELKTFLSQAGRQLTDKQQALVKKALDTATKYLEEGQKQKSVAAILPVLGSGGAGEAVQQAETFGKKLVDQARSEFEAAEKKLESADTAVEGALELLQFSRDFGKFAADLAKELKQVNLRRNHKDTREAFTQAAALDGANILAANKKTKEATAKYQAIVKKYPDTVVAKMAEEKLQALNNPGAVPVKPVKATLDTEKRGESKTELSKPGAPNPFEQEFDAK
jgi:hypothetical protein